jgi:hypothetical protein
MKKLQLLAGSIQDFALDFVNSRWLSLLPSVGARPHFGPSKHGAAFGIAYRSRFRKARHT